MKRMIRNGRLVSIPTLPVTNCDNCGACCRGMGTPPGFAAFYPIDGVIAEWAEGTEDHELWLRFKADRPEAEAELQAYYDGVKDGTIVDRTAGYDLPCLWYDEATKRCRHYEYRPTTCREALQPGDEDCLRIRRMYRIPLPVAG